MIENYLRPEDFGAIGEGGSDHLAFQLAIDEAISAGGPTTIFVAAGDYHFNEPLLADLRKGQTISFLGDSADSTKFISHHSGTCLSIVGDPKGGIGSHDGGSVRNIGFLKRGAEGEKGVGLSLYGLAFYELDDCTFSAFHIGTRMLSVLSGRVERSRWEWNGAGLLASQAGGPSSHNAMVYANCHWRNNSLYGMKILSGASTVNYLGGSFENNGADSVWRGGLWAEFTGKQGIVGVNLDGTYFEGNRSGYDLRLHSSSINAPVVCNAKGCNFNRIHARDYAINNIRLSGKLTLNIIGCGFSGFASYRPSAKTKYIETASGTTVNEFGCVFESALEAPERDPGDGNPLP